MDHRLTNSQLSTAKTCLRKHQLAYVLGIRPDRDAMPLRMGKAFHLGLDEKSKGKSADESILSAIATYDKAAPHFADAEHETDWLVEREIVSCLLSAYFWRWAEMDAALTVVASEMAFEMPLLNPETNRASRKYVYAGRIDKIVRLSDGRLAVMEHKTSGSDLTPESDYWKRLRIDSQISNYCLGARHLGHHVETVLYDVTRKPSIRLKKTETVAQYSERLIADIGARPEWYFARREIPRLEADLTEAAFDLWQTAQIVGDCDRLNRWPRNTSSCVGFGKCAYFDLCTNAFNPETSEIPPGFLRVVDPHQELAET